MHIARQHTFAAFAISVLESTLTVLEPALRGGNQGPQLDKIQRWLRDCIDAMPRRQGSAGADREATALYQRIEPYFVTMQQTDDEREAVEEGDPLPAGTLWQLVLCNPQGHPSGRMVEQKADAPVRLSISLRPSVIERLDAIASDLGMTRSGVINLAAREYIDRQIGA